MYKRYINCIRKWKIRSYFGPWSTVAVNYNFAVTDHYDRDDFKEGWCFDYIWGKWRNGGNLVFPEWNVTIECEPNMLIAFPSTQILHRVSPYKGKRFSMVLFTGNTLFRYRGKPIEDIVPPITVFAKQLTLKHKKKN